MSRTLVTKILQGDVLLATRWLPWGLQKVKALEKRWSSGYISAAYRVEGDVEVRVSTNGRYSRLYIHAAPPAPGGVYGLMRSGAIVWTTGIDSAVDYTNINTAVFGDTSTATNDTVYPHVPVVDHIGFTRPMTDNGNGTWSATTYTGHEFDPYFRYTFIDHRLHGHNMVQAMYPPNTGTIAKEHIDFNYNRLSRLPVDWQGHGGEVLHFGGPFRRYTMPSGEMWIRSNAVGYYGKTLVQGRYVLFGGALHHRFYVDGNGDTIDDGWWIVVCGHAYNANIAYGPINDDNDFVVMGKKMPSVRTHTSFEQEVIDLVNEEREAVGLPPFNALIVETQIARDHADAQAAADTLLVGDQASRIATIMQGVGFFTEVLSEAPPSYTPTQLVADWMAGASATLLTDFGASSSSSTAQLLMGKSVGTNTSGNHVYVLDFLEPKYDIFDNNVWTTFGLVEFEDYAFLPGSLPTAPTHFDPKGDKFCSRWGVGGAAVIKETTIDWQNLTISEVTLPNPTGADFVYSGDYDQGGTLKKVWFGTDGTFHCGTAVSDSYDSNGKVNPVLHADPRFDFISWGTLDNVSSTWKITRAGVTDVVQTYNTGPCDPTHMNSSHPLFAQQWERSWGHRNLLQGSYILAPGLEVISQIYAENAFGLWNDDPTIFGANAMDSSGNVTLWGDFDMPEPNNIRAGATMADRISYSSSNKGSVNVHNSIKAAGVASNVLPEDLWSVPVIVDEVVFFSDLSYDGDGTDPLNILDYYTPDIVVTKT